MINSINYQVTDPKTYTSEVEGLPMDEYQWRHIIKTVDLRNKPNLKNTFVLLGFAVDEGVSRNHGRIGAKEGPTALRKIIANLPAASLKGESIIDAGTIVCVDRDLEGAQLLLAYIVNSIITAGGFPLIIGGGHEITYGHFLGIRENKTGNIGIINFDAHFDLRSDMYGGNSGTGFFQISKIEHKIGNPLHYLAIGIQPTSNAQALFKRAVDLNVDWINSDKFHFLYSNEIKGTISRFLSDIDHLYITVDMDVFAAPFAPGVSAPAYNGIIPDTYFLQLFDYIVCSPKLVSIDFAELNPTYDQDLRTARLAAELLFRTVLQKDKQRNNRS